MSISRSWALRGAITLISLIVLYQCWIFVRVLDLRTSDPKQSAMMEQRLDEMREQTKPARIDYRWVPMQKISPYLKRALIVSEDATFYGHEGFDWDGLKYAAQANLQKGKVVAGGSTISQQLAKNLFLSEQRTPWRKAQEAIITVMLEKTLSKKRILELYLNIIEWGDGVFGAEAASRHYFGKSANRLTPWEAARLAAMVPAPRYYDKHRGTKKLVRKTNLIVKRMAKRYGSNFNSTPKFIAPPVTQPAPELTLEPESEEPAQTGIDGAPGTTPPPPGETATQPGEPTPAPQETTIVPAAI